MYRNPRTTQERRFNQSCPFTRAKRRNIPTSYDDIRVKDNGKSWKKKRKTQYHLNNRGQRHEVFLDYHYCEWEIEEYFEAQNIPFSLDSIKESGYNNTRAYKRVVVKTIPTYRYEWKLIDGKYQQVAKHQMGYVAIYDWMPCGYTTYRYSRVIGFKLIWWSDKDIGLEYLLSNNTGHPWYRLI